MRQEESIYTHTHTHTHTQMKGYLIDMSTAAETTNLTVYLLNIHSVLNFPSNFDSVIHVHFVLFDIITFS